MNNMLLCNQRHPIITFSTITAFCILKSLYTLTDAVNWHVYSLYQAACWPRARRRCRSATYLPQSFVTALHRSVRPFRHILADPEQLRAKTQADTFPDNKYVSLFHVAQVAFTSLRHCFLRHFHPIPVIATSLERLEGVSSHLSHPLALKGWTV